MRQTFVLLSLLLGFIGCNTNTSPPPIVIGHVSDKTRTDKAGDQAELGIRLALHDLNKNNALTEALGGRAVQVRHTDAHGELAAFESEAVRLDSVNRCLALVGGLSAFEVAALDHVKVPLLTFHGQPVSGASNQVFYLGMAPARQGKALGKAVVEDRNIDRIVILLDERRGDLTTLAEAFQKEANAARQDRLNQFPTIVIIRFGKEAKWDELVKRIDNAAAQAIVFAGNVEDFNAWHRVFRQTAASAEARIVYAGNDGDSVRFDPGDAKTAVLLATAFYAEPESEKIKTFLKTYRDEFQVDADVHSALAYDGFRMLAEAMKNAASQLTSDWVRDELAKLKDFDGLTGKLSITDDRQVERPIYVINWENGTLRLVRKAP